MDSIVKEHCTPVHYRWIARLQKYGTLGGGWWAPGVDGAIRGAMFDL